jgi:hypothetical protein
MNEICRPIGVMATSRTPRAHPVLTPRSRDQWRPRTRPLQTYGPANVRLRSSEKVLSVNEAINSTGLHVCVRVDSTRQLTSNSYAPMVQVCSNTVVPRVAMPYAIEHCAAMVRKKKDPRSRDNIAQLEGHGAYILTTDDPPRHSSRHRSQVEISATNDSARR